MIPRALALSLMIGLATSGCGRAANGPSSGFSPVGSADRRIASRAESLAVFERPAMLGASVTAGYMSRTPLPLAFAQTWVLPRRTVCAATPGFFLAPERSTRAQLAVILRIKPTCVIGLDYLFWFVYGEKSFEQRLAGLEQAFLLLADFDGPLFLGDIPDMHGASPGMLLPSWIPPRDQFEAINRRVQELARARPRTVVMPLARWDDALKHGSPLEIGGEQLTPDPEQVMSWDRLHPNRRGVVLLAVLIADQIRRRYPALDGRDLRLDPAQVEARMQIGDMGDAAGSTQLSD